MRFYARVYRRSIQVSKIFDPEKMFIPEKTFIGLKFFINLRVKNFEGLKILKGEIIFCLTLNLTIHLTQT